MRKVSNINFVYVYNCKHVKYKKTHRVDSKHPPNDTRLVTWDDTPVACFANAYQPVLLVWRSSIHLRYTQDNLRCIDCDRIPSDRLSRTPNTASATFHTLDDVGLCSYDTFGIANWVFPRPRFHAINGVVRDNQDSKEGTGTGMTPGP